METQQILWLSVSLFVSTAIFCIVNDSMWRAKNNKLCGKIKVLESINQLLNDKSVMLHKEKAFNKKLIGTLSDNIVYLNRKLSETEEKLKRKRDANGRFAPKGAAI